ncbi:MAG: flagellar protein FlbD [Spartobacteria bacterium]|nr:flagellar protein FlbD [Spartobacteria bacterium]
MINVTDLHGQSRFVNAELIEYIEANPDTQIVMTSGHRFYTAMTPQEVADKVMAYKKDCYSVFFTSPVPVKQGEENTG